MQKPTPVGICARASPGPRSRAAASSASPCPGSRSVRTQITGTVHSSASFDSGVTEATAGSASGASSRASQPAGTIASELSSTTGSSGQRRAASNPWLTEPMKPRFTSCSIRVARAPCPAAQSRSQGRTRGSGEASSITTMRQSPVEWRTTRVSAAQVMSNAS